MEKEGMEGGVEEVKEERGLVMLYITLTRTLI